MTAFKTLLFTTLVPGAATVLIPYLLLSSGWNRFPIDLGPFRYLGLVLILTGVPIYLWCAWDFTFSGKGTPAPIDPPRRLVARGLYRFVRNPMYVGILSILFGEFILFESLLLLVYAGLIFLRFYLFVIFYEEPALTRKFGQSYIQYCDTVPRWIPRRPPNR